MRVCLDVSAAAQGRGGIGRYAARLAAALADARPVDLTLVYHGRRASRLPTTLAGLPARHVRLGSKAWRASLALGHLLRLRLDR